MRPLQTPPGDGDQNRHAHFRHVRTDNEERWDAWLAGPIQWYTCHTYRKTKPCVYKITHKQVACRYCKEGVLPIEVMGFVPLYRHFDSARVFVLIHEDQREVASKLYLHQSVHVGRGADKSDGVYVAPFLGKGPQFETSLRERRMPADIWPVLLRIWKVEELTEWWQSQPDTDPITCIESRDIRARVTDRGEVVSPMTQAAARRVGLPPADAAQQAEYDAVLEKLKHATASKNGHHPNGKHDKKE